MYTTIVLAMRGTDTILAIRQPRFLSSSWIGDIAQAATRPLRGERMQNTTGTSTGEPRQDACRLFGHFTVSVGCRRFILTHFFFAAMANASCGRQKPKMETDKVPMTAS
eukprot:COSAG02_NODE_37873_length_436_cov_0.952522_1_plen_108_part_10